MDGIKVVDYSIRVAIVKNMYVVIIRLKSEKDSKFITAYWADNSISKILAMPKWVGYIK